MVSAGNILLHWRHLTTQTSETLSERKNPFISDAPLQGIEGFILHLKLYDPKESIRLIKNTSWSSGNVR